MTGTSPPLEAPLAAAAPPGVVNLANAITMLRLVMVPIFAAALLRDAGASPRWRIGAGLLFVVASLTDRVDGEIARRRNLVTDFGKIADPIADKALTGTALVVLSTLGELAWAVTVVVLVREIGVTVLRFGVIRYGVIPASRGGKLKTLLQIVAILLYVLPLAGLWGSVRAVVMTAAVAVTLVTGADYLVQALRMRRGALRQPRAAG
jgi:CDP-diacylglycerol---glycerol-3-phosphate 3-phosphatidyltransferase